MTVQMDVSREDDVERGFADAVADLGGLDLLVNNAGSRSPTSSSRCRSSRGRRSSAST